MIHYLPNVKKNLYTNAIAGNKIRLTVLKMIKTLYGPMNHDPDT